MAQLVFNYLFDAESSASHALAKVDVIDKYKHATSVTYCNRGVYIDVETTLQYALYNISVRRGINDG